jgi:hypothetical protein
VIDAVEKIMVRSLEGGSLVARSGERCVKRREPSITDAMKDAKIIPRGKEGAAGDWVDFKAGVQKNTKRYMEPSKKQEASPRVKIRVLVKTRFRMEGFAAGALETGVGDELREEGRLEEVSVGIVTFCWVALSP